MPSPNNVVACPACKTRLRVPEGAGRIRCPNCQQTLQTSGGGQSSPSSNPPASGATTLNCPGCSKAMKVPAGMEGKQIKCPHCASVLKIAGKPGPAGVQKPVAPQRPVAPQSPARPTPAATSSSPSSIFDDLGVSSSTSSSSPLDEMMSSGTPPPPPSYGQASPYSQPLSPAPTNQNPYAATSQSMPQSGGNGPPPNIAAKAFGITAVAAALVGFGATAAFPPIGWLIFFFVVLPTVGIVSTVGSIWTIVIAFQEDVTQGLLVWFVPFYVIFYQITRWNICWLPTLLSWVPTLGLFLYMMGLFAGTLIGALIWA